MKGEIDKKIEKRKRMKVTPLTILLLRVCCRDEKIQRNKRKCTVQVSGEGSLDGGLEEQIIWRNMYCWQARSG